MYTLNLFLTQLTASSPPALSDQSGPCSRTQCPCPPLGHGTGVTRATLVCGCHLPEPGNPRSPAGSRPCSCGCDPAPQHPSPQNVQERQPSCVQWQRQFQSFFPSPNRVLQLQHGAVPERHSGFALGTPLSCKHFLIFPSLQQPRNLPENDDGTSHPPEPS